MTNYIPLMKVYAGIVLFSVMLGVFLPASLPFVPVHQGETTICVVDVCHSQSPALSAAGEMPYLSERHSPPVPLFLLSHSSAEVPLFSQPLFTIRNDRPPVI